VRNAPGRRAMCFIKEWTRVELRGTGGGDKVAKTVVSRDAMPPHGATTENVPDTAKNWVQMKEIIKHANPEGLKEMPSVEYERGSRWGWACRCGFLYDLGLISKKKIYKHLRAWLRLGGKKKAGEWRWGSVSIDHYHETTTYTPRCGDPQATALKSLRMGGS